MKTLWFKAKTYGWGWYPVTWQGWAVTLGYVAVISILATNLVLVIPGAIAATAALLSICWKTGERPSWRWGDKK